MDRKSLLKKMNIIDNSIVKTKDYNGGLDIDIEPNILGRVNDLEVYVVDLKKKLEDALTRIESLEGGGVVEKRHIYNPYKNAPSNTIKFQMHCHSSSSDGVQTSGDVVKAYFEVGYKAVAVTNHDYISKAYYNGYYGIKSVEESEVKHHIGVIGVLSQASTEDRVEVCKYHRKNNANAIITVNHPNRSGQSFTDEELMNCDYDCIEIYNEHDDNTTYEAIWDSLLSRGKKVWGVCADDCHDVTKEHSFNGSWIEVLSPSADQDDMLSAIKKGQFYACRKHDISISYDELTSTITASSTSESNFTFITHNGVVVKTENGVTTSSYTIKEEDVNYIRVRSDSVARPTTFACSQPFFLDYKGETAPIGKEVVVSGYTFEAGAFEEDGSEKVSSDTCRSSYIDLVSNKKYKITFPKYCTNIRIVYFNNLLSLIDKTSKTTIETGANETMYLAIPNGATKFRFEMGFRDGTSVEALEASKDIVISYTDN